MEKYAIYARVSTELDAQKTSYESQTQDLQAKVKILYPNFELVKVYGDLGISGTKENRPDFQQMIDDAKSGKFSIIVTKSISRFARNVRLLLNTLKELEDYKIRVIFLEEGIDTSQVTQKFLVTMLGALAELESDNLKEHIREAKEVKWASGKQAYPQCCPYGYRQKNGTITIYEEEAKVIKQIFKWFLERHSPNWITKTLNEKEIPAKHSCGWNVVTVKRMLKNRKYIGEALELDKKTGEVHKFNYPPIISEEDFNEAQTRFYHHTNHRKPQLYPLSHKCYCMSCGQKITRIPKGKKPHFLDDPSSGYASWGCASFTSGKLSCHGGWMISETYLYEMVIESLIQEFYSLTSEEKDNYCKSLLELTEQPIAEDYTKEWNTYQKTKTKLENQKSKLIDLYQNDIISMEDVKAKSKKIDKQLRELVVPKAPRNSKRNLFHMQEFIKAINNEDIKVARTYIIELFCDRDIKKMLCDLFLEKVEFLTIRHHVRIILKNQHAYTFSVEKRSPSRTKFSWPTLIKA